MIEYRMKKKVGKHRMANGNVILPGDIVKVKSVAEFGGAIDKFELVNPEAVAQQVAKEEEPVVSLQVVAGELGFDVVNPTTGQKLNTNPLTEEDACKLAGIEYVQKSREEIIKEAIENLDEDDWTATDPPRPKVSAVRTATKLSDVSADEIAEVMANG